MDNDEDWFDGYFDIQWVGPPPPTCSEDDDQLPCEKYDFNVTDGGLLSLRDKENSKIHIYAPHTWHHIEVSSYMNSSCFVSRR